MTQTSDLDRLWEHECPESIEKKISLSLAETANLAPHEKLEQAALLTQMARAQGLQRKLTEASETLKKAETVLSEIPPSACVGVRIQLLLEAGRIHILSKTPSQARELFVQAFRLAREANDDFYAIDSIQMMATIEPQKQQFEWRLKALAMAKDSTQPRARQCIGILHGLVGLDLFEARRFGEALENFQIALKLSQEAGSTQQHVTQNQWRIARTLRAMNRVGEALPLLHELKGPSLLEGLVLEEIAECLQASNRTEEAQSYFDQAYGLLSKDVWIQDNASGRLKRLKDLGKSK